MINTVASANNITKKFGNFIAVNNLSLEIKKKVNYSVS